MEPVVEKVINYGHAGTMAYKWFFMRNALHGVFRRHRVITSHRRSGLDENFYYSQKAKNLWNGVFRVPEGTNVPFTVYSHAGAVALMIIITDLRINFRHLMHLKSEMKFFKSLETGSYYEIFYTFEEVMRIKHDKAALVSTTLIRKDGEIFMEIRDHFVVKNIPVKYADRLRWDETEEFKGITRIPAEPVRDSVSTEIFIPAALPVNYSRVSGDYNIIHICPSAVKLSGYDRPFIQGLCTANLVLRELCVSGIVPSYYSIVFCRPVYTNSRVHLNFNSSEYRLLDEAGNVLCFGRISKQDA